MALVYDAKVAEAKRLSEALLMLDTSRIVARGYAIVKKEESVVDSVESLKKKDQVTLLMRDGQVELEVKDVKTKKFEENLAELETIVQSLENGEIALEDAITAFQKGMVLSKELQATLDKAEKTLVKVMQEDGTESDFE